jgi:glycosyltransferase involved in cell wall biosynthesis
MKVAIFASAFHPHLGGVEELVRQLAHAYRAQGVEAHVVTVQWPRELPAFEEHEGIPVHRVSMAVPNELGGLSVAVRSRARFLRSKHAIDEQIKTLLTEHGIDLIHVQCISAAAYYARRAARALRLPLVVTSQGERTMDAEQIFQRSPFFVAMLHDVLSSANFLTACSQDTLRDLEQFRGRAFGDKARVVYNGIALSDFDGVAPHQHTRPYVLGIGRFVAQKGFDVLLRAFAAAGLQGHDLLLAGEGEEYSALEKLIEELGLQGRAHLLGRADRAQTIALFKGAEFFVLPSRREPLGIVNLEAMAAGKAVIATRVGGVPEIVKHDETGMLVAPEDAGALAQAMSTLANDKSKREAYGRAGRERAEKFDWQMIAAQYLEIYRDLIRGKNAETEEELA